MKTVSKPELSEGRRARGRSRRGFDWNLVGVLAVVVAMAAVGWTMRTDRTMRSGLFVIPAVFVLMFPILRRVGRGEKRFDLAGLMACSLALRMVLLVPRTRGAVDAVAYHRVGMQLADSFRHFQFGVDTGRQVPGTGTIRYLSGLVHVVVFDDFFASMVVLTMLAFWGTWLFYKAFTIALPDAQHYRYAKLIFLWPSMLFWTSSLGKEAVMTFTLGLMALGFAMLIVKRWSGLAVLLVGVGGTVLIRPHVALVAVVAMFVVLLVPKSAEGWSLGIGTRVVGLVTVLVLGAILSRVTAEFLDLENLSNSSIDTALSSTEVMTDQGGSDFGAARVRSPVDYPVAVVTVLIRPFPIEAHTSESFATSVEGLVLGALLIGSYRQLWSIPRLSMRYSYVAFCTAYVLIFCFVFSVVGNFGILARQRTQVLPLLFVLVSVPILDSDPAVGRRSRGRGRSRPVGRGHTRQELSARP